MDRKYILSNRLRLRSWHSSLQRSCGDQGIEGEGRETRGAGYEMIRIDNILGKGNHWPEKFQRYAIRHFQSPGSAPQSHIQGPMIAGDA